MALKNNYENLDTLDDGVYYRCTGTQTTQLFACADLENTDDTAKLRQLLPQTVGIVYSDPPWDPGNRKYWRTHAEADHDGNYDSFLDPWAGLIGECIAERGTRHVFTEQSNNDDNRGLFYDAVERCEEWTLPLDEEYTVYYGSPGSASRQNPNVLCHFADEPLATDPSGLDGEPMTIRACAGIDAPPGSTVLDPCMGKGMTSRMALYNQWHCVGTELNPKRLGKTITWLERHDFDVERCELPAEGGGIPEETPDEPTTPTTSAEPTAPETTADAVAAYNEQAAALPTPLEHPCLYPRIVHKDDLEANDYNPNQVPDPELKLLEQSIQKDGLTMTIVTYERADGTFEIVDGFHRYHDMTKRMGAEWIPVSVIDKSLDERMSSTVRHNRARGDHTTELMGGVVEAMEDEGLEPETIAEELGMEHEELVRLKQVSGAAELLASDDYGQSWGVQDAED